MVSKMMSLDEASEQVNAMQIRDQIVDTSGLKIQYVNKEQLVVDSDVGKFVVEYPETRSSIEKHLGISPYFLSEYESDPDLIQKLVDYSLTKRQNKKVRFVHSGNTLWHVFDHKYPWINTQDAFQTVAETIKEKQAILGVAQVDFDEKLRCTAKFVLDQAKDPPKARGDFSHAGIWFRSNGVVESSAFVYRMVCSNGAMRDYRRSVHKSPVKLQESVRNNALASLNDSNTFLSQFVDLYDQPTPDPAPFIAYVARIKKYSDKLVTTIMEKLPSLKKPYTKYDVVNLITQTAQEQEDNTYEWLGGEIASEYSHHACNSCGRPVG